MTSGNLRARGRSPDAVGWINRECLFTLHAKNHIFAKSYMRVERLMKFVSALRFVQVKTQR